MGFNLGGLFKKQAAGSVERTVASNATAGAQEIFGAAKNLPLLGVTKEGADAIAGRANAIKSVFSEEGKAMRKETSEQVKALNGEDGILSSIAKDHNTAKGLTGDQAITKDHIAGEINKAYASGGSEQKGQAMSNIKEKYGMNDGHIDQINNTMQNSQKVADSYYNAAKAPFGMAKDYILDGSPLATYAKGAVGVTALQFMNGSRTSLTQQNGQKDIAGVPFI